MTPQIMLLWLGGAFALIVGGVVTLFVLDVFFNTKYFTGGGGSTIFANNTYSANATLKASAGVYNVFDQFQNVGKLAGVSLIIGVLALMGVGGFMMYRRIKS